MFAIAYGAGCNGIGCDRRIPFPPQHRERTVAKFQADNKKKTTKTSGEEY